MKLLDRFTNRADTDEFPEVAPTAETDPETIHQMAGAKPGKAPRGTKPGLDSSKTSPIPDAVTIIAIVAMLLAGFGIQKVFASDARAQIPGLERDVATRKAEVAALEARYREVIDTTRDEILGTLRHQSLLLDQVVLPRSIGEAIEQFEVELPNTLQRYGITLKSQVRGQITDDRGTPGAWRVSIRLELEGRRADLFNFVEYIRSVRHRSITLGQLDLEGEPDDTIVTMDAPLILWFADAPDLYDEEAEFLAQDPDAYRADKAAEDAARGYGQFNADGTPAPDPTVDGSQPTDPSSEPSPADVPTSPPPSTSSEPADADADQSAPPPSDTASETNAG